MSAALSIYRAVTLVVGAVATPIGRALAPRASAWRARFGATAGAEAAAGGPWVHAASLGEAGAALAWVRALVASGYRPPMLVTARTAAGLARLRTEGGAQVVASSAPIDFPQAVRGVLRDAAPIRLDLIETELWPNLLLEAHASGLPVVAVSATVSARTAARLRAAGLGGPALFGPLHVLAQSERHAERFLALGVSPERCRVVGDLKAEGSPASGAAAAEPDAAARRLLVFASLRPGEEEVAVALARALAARRDAASWRWIVAPRHDRGASLLRDAFRSAGLATEWRDESSRAASPVVDWATRPLRDGAAPSVGVLTTRGELSELLPHARAAVVGGTFAPWGGHNVLEPAARGCPVIVGPHHEEVEAGVALLVAHGGGVIVKDGVGAAATLSSWLDEPVEPRASQAVAAARAAGGAA
ncbi:MAG TPA: glycosyltransferase N-terminal domain-containing protein, partial [Candidatus Eisenbacteria bacterium]|nr:glycosyltransferase N-terminal domain-containing protein [Candidatus Eisenbacteria bacterium]